MRRLAGREVPGEGGACGSSSAGSSRAVTAAAALVTEQAAQRLPRPRTPIAGPWYRASPEVPVPGCPSWGTSLPPLPVAQDTGQSQGAPSSAAS